MATMMATRGNLVKGVVAREVGGPEVLVYTDVEVGEPGEGQVKVKNKAIGLNFIDVYYRTGVYVNEKPPFILGREAAGEVMSVGPGVSEFKIGDRVGYGGTPMGSYVEEQILPALVLVPIPEAVDFVTAAAILLKGMTARYLVRECFKIKPGNAVLVHAAAGGTGSLVCQWARALGANVIGCVSNEEKATQAMEDGCHHVIIYTKEDFVERVKSITGNKGVQVVYDSVGKSTLTGSLECLAFRGYLVSFGQASGAPDPLPLSALSPKSAFLTRPSLMHYTADRKDLLETAKDLFENVAAGVLKVRINQTYPLSQAAAAHIDLEGRKTTGSTVLIPSN